MKLDRMFRLSLCILYCTLILGCSKRYHSVPSFVPVNLFLDDDNQGVGSFKTAYLADQIVASFPFADPGSVGITTIVNLSDLTEVTDFGLILSEQILSELTLRGFNVLELRQGQFIKFSDGERILTREEAEVRASLNIGVIVAGTYMVGDETVYVNVRVLDPHNSQTLGAGSVEIARTSEVNKLLRKKRGAVVDTIRIKQQAKQGTSIFE